MAEQRFTGKFMFALGGLLIWAGHFLAVYLFAATACAWRFANMEFFGIGILPIVIIAMTIAAIAGVTWNIVAAVRWRGPIRGERHDDSTARFLRYTTITVALLSLVAITWEALPALIVPFCT